MLDSHWMPRLMPDTAEATKQTVRIATITTSTGVPIFADPAVGRQAAADLEGAKAQRGGGAEQRGEDGQDVDELADGPFDHPDAKKRGEGRGDELLAPQPVGAVGHGDADNRVHGPGVQGPVEDGRCHGGLDGCGGASVHGSGRRGDVVVEGFSHAVEHEPDAHAGGEHHGYPGDGAEFGFFPVFAQRDVAELAERPATARRPRRARPGP